MNRPRSIAVALAPLLILGAAMAQDEPSRAQLDWLRANGFAYDAVEAGRGFADLKPLKEMLGEARIVGLGEATHGSREVFQMKHRLLEFLVSEMGFSIFSIEANMPECERLNAYVLGGGGDPKALIAGMYFWTWNTQEVLAMVEWMRAYNAAGEGRLQFTGFDMQYPDVARRNVLAFLEVRDPDDRLGLRSALSKLERVRSGSDGSCSVVGRVPARLAAGRRVEVRAQIRTEGLEGGRATIWCSAQGRDRQVLATRDLLQDAPRGTTDWDSYAIDVDVPEVAVDVAFGLSVHGRGKAWFDSVEVLLDGEVWAAPEAVDLGFESEKLRGFETINRSFRVSMDREVAHAGAQSLLLEGIAPDSGATPAREALRLSRKVLRAMRGQRESWIGDDAAVEVDWAIQNARVLWQSVRKMAAAAAGRGTQVRDECMADNVEWILEQNPGARIVLWAHNGHIARQRSWMGSHLAECFGADYVPVAFATHSGRYRARHPERRDRWIHDLRTPGTGTVEHVLKALGEPRWILDWRGARADDPGSAWLTQRPMLRSIGARAVDLQFAATQVVEDFDLLIWIERTSASVSLIEGH